MRCVNRLDPAFKAKWVEALRSGKYEQGHDLLRGDGKFCCLGVALDLVDSSQWMPDGWGAVDWRDTPLFGLDDTDKLAEKLPLTKETCLYLASLNDGTQANEPQRKCEFPEIARWIEVNL